MQNEKEYRQLQKRVYEIIFPEGKPLERGLFLNGNGISNGLILDFYFNGKVLYAHGNQTREINLKEALKIVEHPLPLQDILRALNKIFSCVKLEDNYLCVADVEERLGEFVGDAFAIKLDLSKPIKEQSKETLIKLYKLIK